MRHARIIVAALLLVVGHALAQTSTGKQTVSDLSELRVKPRGAATSGALADHLAGWANVKTYGAKGDGATDDTAAIQAAYNAVPAAGGTVFFPPGVYVLANNGIRLQNRSNIRFEGRRAVTLKAPIPNTQQYFAVWITDCSHITFSGLIFDRQNSYAANKPLNYREDGIFIERSPFTVVEDCDFSETFFGVYITDSPTVTVERSTMIGRLPYSVANETAKTIAGFLVNVLDTAGHISNHGRMVNCYAELVQNMIYAEDADDWVISGNTSKDGIDSQLYFKGLGLTVTDNVIENAGKDGIKLLAINPGTYGSQKSVVANNVIRKPGKMKSDGGNAIIVTGDSFAVTGNVIELDALANLAAIATRGIALETQQAVVTGNEISGAAWTSTDVVGIWSIFNAAVYAGDQTHVLISNNIIAHCRTGIQVTGDATYTLSDYDITGNHVSDVQYGVYVAGQAGHAALAKRLNISSNTVIGATVNGVSLTEVTQAWVRQNVLTGTATINSGGIQLTTAGTVLVQGNAIQTFPYGIVADATSSAVTTHLCSMAADVGTPFSFADPAIRTDLDFFSLVGTTVVTSRSMQAAAFATNGSFQPGSSNRTVEIRGSINNANNAVAVRTGTSGAALSTSGASALDVTKDAGVTPVFRIKTDGTIWGPTFQSPDGTWYIVKVANGGALSTAVAP